MSVFENDLHLGILLEDGTGYKLYPDDSEDAQGIASYKLYELAAENFPSEFVCGNDGSDMQFRPKDGTSMNRSSGGGGGGPGPLTVFLEVDYATYVSLGGSIDNVITQITTLFAAAASHFQHITCGVDVNGVVQPYCVSLQISEIYIE